MENKENNDVSDNNQSIRDQLKRSNANWKDALVKLDDAVSANEQLQSNQDDLMATNKQLRNELEEQKKRIQKFEEYGETAERLVQSLHKYIGDLMPGLKIPMELQTPTTTTTTNPAVDLITASASLSPPPPAAAVASKKRASSVNIVLTPTQTLHLQPNVNFQLIEHGKQHCAVY